MADEPRSILLLGAYGFIGSAIADALLADGHKITGFGRNVAFGKTTLPQVQWIKGDLRDYCDPASWQPLIKSIEIVINASGILQSGPSDNVNITQTDAIISLIEACETSHISQIIQISACGASVNADHNFMQSKAQADLRLIESSINATILRPGLVIGRNSYGGTELIRMVSAMPFLAPRLKGFGQVQCVALSDVVDAVRQAIAAPQELSGSYDLVESKSLPLDQIIAWHRSWLGFKPARLWIPVGRGLMKLVAIGSDALGWLGWRSPMRTNAIQSLIDGVDGKADQTTSILGRPALSLDTTLNNFSAGKQDRIHARLMLALPVFLVMLVLLWLGSGLVGLAKTDEAAALLNQSAVAPSIAKAMVGGGVLIDILLGIGLMLRKTVRIALVGTILMTLAYLTGGAILTPELWLDPLAPLIKALAAMGLSITCLIALDKR